LPLAAIDEENVGENLALVVEPLEPPGDDFADARRVVDPLNVPDLVVLVARLETIFHGFPTLVYAIRNINAKRH
jgi:hypothetical protein